MNVFSVKLVIFLFAVRSCKFFCSKRSHLSTLPTCGPVLILPPAVKRWGPPGRQVLFIHLAHLWATSYYAPRCEAVGAP